MSYPPFHQKQIARTLPECSKALIARLTQALEANNRAFLLAAQVFEKYLPAIHLA
ncbi:hypothetical protein NPS52_17495 [Pseudomonas putida]|nr:hypothetical protein [Pseudomonas putida]